MTTTAGHSFYIGPIGYFYNQVNDTGCMGLHCLVYGFTSTYAILSVAIMVKVVSLIPVHADIYISFN